MRNSPSAFFVHIYQVFQDATAHNGTNGSAERRASTLGATWSGGTPGLTIRHRTRRIAGLLASGRKLVAGSSLPHRAHRFYDRHLEAVGLLPSCGTTSCRGGARGRKLRQCRGQVAGGMLPHPFHIRLGRPANASLALTTAPLQWNRRWEWQVGGSTRAVSCARTKCEFVTSADVAGAFCGSFT